MIEILKRQWFVVLIGAILVSFLIFSVYDTNKGKLPGKKVDGKDIIASIDDKNISADEIFEQLKKSSSDELIFAKFQDAVASTAIETTDEIKQEAKTLQQNIEEQFKVNDPTNYKNTIQNQMDIMGYDNLSDYCMKNIKLNKLKTNYIDQHMDELFTPIYDKKNSRIVAHILVKMEDANNPTDAEKTKIQAVEDALKNGTSFADVAKEHSEDVSSAVNGGSIGYTDTDSGLVEEFKKVALSLKKGEISDWVKVTSTNYSGWHKILVVETDKKAIEDTSDEFTKNTLYRAILENNPDLPKTIIWEAAKNMNIEYGSDEIKKQLMNYMGVEEDKK